MTPGTRLLEAVRASTRNPSPRENLTGRERELLDATEALSDARALYPAAHALGDRVAVVYPAGEVGPNFAGKVLSLHFFSDRTIAQVKRDDGQVISVDSAFVHPAPDLCNCPLLGPDPCCRFSAGHEGQCEPPPSWFPMDGRRVSPRVAAQMHDMAVATGRVPTAGIDARSRADPATVADVEYPANPGEHVPVVARTSRRNLPLVYQGPLPTITTLTVENYCKWYELQAVHPDGRVEPVSYGALEGFRDGNEMTPYVDHVPNPVLVERLCNAMGWELDEQSHEMMIGRWVMEGMDMTLSDVHRAIRPPV